MIIIKEDGQIVSHVSIIPLKAFVRGRVLEVGGIGGVATKAEYRQRGFASKILNYCVSRMEEEVDLSLLPIGSSFFHPLRQCPFSCLYYPPSLQNLPLAGNLIKKKVQGFPLICKKIRFAHFLPRGSP